MLYGRNLNGKIVNILESVESQTYTCPVCGEELVRNFGLQRQYFSHSKDKAKDCELKLKRILEEEKKIRTEEEMEILDREYFNKDFGDIPIELSDLTTEEGYKLTKEQCDIINSKEDKIIIQASAGASKSYTLYRYAKARPNKKFLYLVYNSAMKQEAERLFMDVNNVTIKTTHGLAYGYVAIPYRHKLTFGYKPIDVFNDLQLDNKDFQLAVYVHNILNQFMLSSKDKIEDMDLYKEEEFALIRDTIISMAKKLWELKNDINSKVKIEHDFYLKKFHLMKKDLSHKFDIVLLDESQDSNEMVFDMIKNMNTKGIVMVGDTFQSMYQFRNSINVMNMLEGATEYKLTTSFRVSQCCANISNILLEDVFGIDFGMSGFNENNKFVHELNPKNSCTVIARTNSTLFNECIIALNEGKRRMFFEGGFNSYRFNDILDCYKFSCGEFVKNNKFNKFKNYSEMVEYAERNQDIELLGFINSVRKYGNDTPQLINKIKKSVCEDRSKSDICFTTAHKSKGATYNDTRLTNDYFSMENFYNKIYIENVQGLERTDLIKQAKIEVCTLYVAITRSKTNMQINDDLKNYLALRYKHKKTLK